MFTRHSPSTGPSSPAVQGFYDKASGSIQYVAWDPATKHAALIDTVLDFDPAHARTRSDSARTALDFVQSEGLKVVWVLDTHPHADHLMASAWLKEQTGAPNAIGVQVHEIAKLWQKIYHLGEELNPDPHFDRFFEDGETFSLGNLEVRVMLSPGHTLGSITYVIGDAAFVHDTFMHVDSGTARADFPGGSSAQLYDSLMEILSLPDNTRLFVGHDYPPVDDRTDPAWEATVADHKANNKHLGGGTGKEAFCKLRDERDETLDLPDRMLHALQVNLRGGRLLEPEADGRSYFKIPANHF